MTTIDTLCATCLVPVVVLDDAADAGRLGDALVDGGLPVAEVTFRTAAAAAPSTNRRPQRPRGC